MTWKHHRAIAYAWMLRQAGKTKQDKHLAKRLVLRHRQTIETEIVRMGLAIDVPMYVEEFTNGNQDDSAAVAPEHGCEHDSGVCGTHAS